MPIGKKIFTIRKTKGITGDQLAKAVGVSPAQICKIEKDRLAGGVDPDMVVKIADFLEDRTILTDYLEDNPVYRAIIPKIFPDLNRIKTDQAIIFSRYADEAQESVDAARILAQIHSNADPAAFPNYCQTLRAKLEQIVDVQRCAEVLFLQLIAAGILTETDRCEIHAAQQRKCEEHGHHRPEEAA